MLERECRTIEREVQKKLQKREFQGPWLVIRDYNKGTIKICEKLKSDEIIQAIVTYR